MPIDRKNYPKITTAVGVAVWPKLRVPDTHFKEEGEFSVKLQLSGEAAQNLIDKIEAFRKVAYDVECVDKGKKKLKLADLPFKSAVDAEGETIPDTYLFNFKRRASGTYKKGAKAGETWHAKIPIYDSAGTLIEDETIDPWSGSQLRVSATLEPWFTASLGLGIKLGLQAVQLIDLVTGEGRTAEAYGFDSNEGGYSYKESTTGGADASESEDEESDSSGDF